MNYARINPYENHCNLIEIAKMCIQFEKYGKLEEVKDLLLSIKRELLEKDSLIEEVFERSGKILEQASRKKFSAALELREW